MNGLQPFTGHAIAHLDEQQGRRLFPQWAEAHPNFVKSGLSVVVALEGPPMSEALR